MFRLRELLSPRRKARANRAFPNKEPVVMAESGVPEGTWPLPFRLHSPPGGLSENSAFWTHELYRGPDGRPVKILYSRTKVESEELAQMFLDEPILGFDMEWPSHTKKETRLQRRIGLIQIACADKVALFHIGQHQGSTPKALIAPSLRKIIESPEISKAGVGVHSADFSRLRQYFDMNPRGAFDLSHLHNLVTHGGKDVAKLNTRAVSLSNQVLQYFGLPLAKPGNVRLSNWSAPLGTRQMLYAAGDAYAGFMLFHCMNAQRVLMEPRPPLPIHAEMYPSGASKLRLGPDGKNTAGILARDFYATPEERERKAQPEKEYASSELTQMLLERLRRHRERAAKERGCDASEIVEDSVLTALSEQCPRNPTEFLRGIKGVTRRTIATHGEAWFAIITGFISEYGPIVIPDHQQVPSQSPEPRTPSPAAVDTATVTDIQDAGPPGLHTGLSFKMESASLKNDDIISVSSHEDDEQQPERPTLGLRKRKRSLEREDSENRSPSKPRASAFKASQRATMSSAKPVPSSKKTSSLLPKETRVFRNKLVAFSKRVASKVEVPVETMDHLVRSPPQTYGELMSIPGIMPFANECARNNKDLLEFISKSTKKTGTH